MSITIIIEKEKTQKTWNTTSFIYLLKQKYKSNEVEILRQIAKD